LQSAEEQYYAAERAPDSNCRAHLETAISMLFNKLDECLFSMLTMKANWIKLSCMKELIDWLVIIAYCTMEGSFW